MEEASFEDLPYPPLRNIALRTGSFHELLNLAYTTQPCYRLLKNGHIWRDAVYARFGNDFQRYDDRLEWKQVALESERFRTYIWQAPCAAPLPHLSLRIGPSNLSFPTSNPDVDMHSEHHAWSLGLECPHTCMRAKKFPYTWMPSETTAEELFASCGPQLARRALKGHDCAMLFLGRDCPERFELLFQDEQGFLARLTHLLLTEIERLDPANRPPTPPPQPTQPTHTSTHTSASTHTSNNPTAQDRNKDLLAMAMQMLGRSDQGDEEESDRDSSDSSESESDRESNKQGDDTRPTTSSHEDGKIQEGEVSLQDKDKDKDKDETAGGRNELEHAATQEQPSTSTPDASESPSDSPQPSTERPSDTPKPEQASPTEGDSTTNSTDTESPDSTTAESNEASGTPTDPPPATKKQPPPPAPFLLSLSQLTPRGVLLDILKQAGVGPNGRLRGGTTQAQPAEERPGEEAGHRKTAESSGPKAGAGTGQPGGRTMGSPRRHLAPSGSMSSSAAAAPGGAGGGKGLVRSPSLQIQLRTKLLNGRVGVGPFEASLRIESPADLHTIFNTVRSTIETSPVGARSHYVLRLKVCPRNTLKQSIITLVFLPPPPSFLATETLSTKTHVDKNTHTGSTSTTTTTTSTTNKSTKQTPEEKQEAKAFQALQSLLQSKQPITLPAALSFKSLLTNLLATAFVDPKSVLVCHATISPAVSHGALTMYSLDLLEQAKVSAMHRLCKGIQGQLPPKALQTWTPPAGLVQLIDWGIENHVPVTELLEHTMQQELIAKLEQTVRGLRLQKRAEQERADRQRKKQEQRQAQRAKDEEAARKQKLMDLRRGKPLRREESEAGAALGESPRRSARGGTESPSRRGAGGPVQAQQRPRPTGENEGKTVVGSPLSNATKEAPTQDPPKQPTAHTTPPRPTAPGRSRLHPDAQQATQANTHSGPSPSRRATSRRRQASANVQEDLKQQQRKEREEKERERKRKERDERQRRLEKLQRETERKKERQRKREEEEREEERRQRVAAMQKEEEEKVRGVSSGAEAVMRDEESSGPGQDLQGSAAVPAPSTSTETPSVPPLSLPDHTSSSTQHTHTQTQAPSQPQSSARGSHRLPNRKYHYHTPPTNKHTQHTAQLLEKSKRQERLNQLQRNIQSQRLQSEKVKQSRAQRERTKMAERELPQQRFFQLMERYGALKVHDHRLPGIHDGNGLSQPALAAPASPRGTHAKVMFPPVPGSGVITHRGHKAKGKGRASHSTSANMPALNLSSLQEVPPPDIKSAPGPKPRRLSPLKSETQSTPQHSNGSQTTRHLSSPPPRIGGHRSPSFTSPTHTPTPTRKLDPLLGNQSPYFRHPYSVSPPPAPGAPANPALLIRRGSHSRSNSPLLPALHLPANSHRETNEKQTADTQQDVLVPPTPGTVPARLPPISVDLLPELVTQDRTPPFKLNANAAFASPYTQ